MFTTHSELHRIDDTSWSISSEDHTPSQFREIRFSISHLVNGEERFELITAIKNLFEANAQFLTKDRFREGFRASINKPDSLVNGTWDIKVHQISPLSKRIFLEIRQRLPFTRKLSERDVAVLDINRTAARASSKLFSTANRIHTLQIQAWEQPSVLNLLLPFTSALSERALTQESFLDPFTRLATEALETICPLFVLEATHKGNYRFVFDKDRRLFLQRLVPVDEAAAGHFFAENAAVVSVYQDFLLQEYGPDTISYIETECGIHFNEIKAAGMPLLPDHVAKCNIAANNIELQHLETLWNGLKILHRLLRPRPHPGGLAYDFLLRANAQLGLPLRIIRNLLRLIPVASGHRPSLENLREFMEGLVGQYTQFPVRELPPDQFNAVVEILMPSDTERQRSFTGRKIRHVCVMGRNTMGNPNTPCPCRDLFELLHIFNDLKQEERWKNFYELLSFFAKKRFYRQNIAPNEAAQTVRVGLLIPGPNGPQGASRWFYIDGFFDDGGGNVNYAILPACNNYRSLDNRPLPFIKLFRDTATKANVENAWDSIRADLNPEGPGSLNPELSLPYEWNHFFDRTIPIWVGYLLLSLRLRSSPLFRREPLLAIQREKTLKMALEAFERYMLKLHPEIPFESMRPWYEAKQFEEIERTLVSFSERFREDPRSKKGQDIACVGHSLGGVLAQQSVFCFSAGYERMPLPGHQFICYSNDSPAATRTQDETFMRFGHAHRDLFRSSSVKWRFCYPFEAGDFLPQAGGSHLGTTGFDIFEDQEWLTVEASVFFPLKEATAPAVVVPSAHSRRFGMAVKNVDYTRISLTPLELAEFDHSFVLSKRMREIWKCSPFNYPKVLELVRSGAGWVSQKTGILWLIKQIEGAGVGVRDRNDVLAVLYASVPQQPQFR